MKRTAALPLLLMLASFAAAQTATTYYQNQQYQFRGTAAAGYFTMYGSNYTVQGGAVVTMDQMIVGSGACAGQAGPPFIGYVFFNTPDGVQQPCAPITATSFGPSIAVNSNGRVCTGPSSAHVEWNGGAYDATFTFFFSPARYGGCYTRTLTGQVTLK
jgi:hypothetical protein